MLSACAQGVAAVAYLPSASEISELQIRNDELGTKIELLEPRVASDLLTDVAVYYEAVAYIPSHPDQFFRQEYYTNAWRLVDLGHRGAVELERGVPSWPKARGPVCLGYRSRVDDSVQPYCV